MVRKSGLGVILLFSFFTLGQLALANQNYEDANQFYNTKVDKKEYEEYSDPKMKVRELVIVRKLPDLIDTFSWDYAERQKQHLKEDVIRNAKGLNSEGIVYFFFSLKDDGNKVSYQYIMYNADTKKPIASVGGNWVKENR